MSKLISYRQHYQITTLLNEWNELRQLHATIQRPGQLVVQVQGAYHGVFVEAAIAASKKILEEKARRVRSDLQQLDYNVAELTPLQENADEPATN